MPRGRRKRGAWHCRLWFENGDRYELQSLPDREFSNAEMAKSIRENLLPMLDQAVAFEKKKYRPTEEPSA